MTKLKKLSETDLNTVIILPGIGRITVREALDKGLLEPPTWEELMGRDRAKERKEKASKRWKNDNPMKRPEIAAKHGKTMTGRKHPYMMGNKNVAKRPEVRALISKAKIGIPSPLKGREFTPEHIANMIEAQNRPEVRAKRSGDNSPMRRLEVLRKRKKLFDMGLYKFPTGKNHWSHKQPEKWRRLVENIKEEMGLLRIYDGKKFYSYDEIEIYKQLLQAGISKEDIKTQFPIGCYAIDFFIKGEVFWEHHVLREWESDETLEEYALRRGRILTTFGYKAMLIITDDVNNISWAIDWLKKTLLKDSKPRGMTVEQ